MRAEDAENGMWHQSRIALRARSRGFHLVTDEIVAGLPQLRDCRVGLLHVWLQHTSASLTVNENADPAVRRDFERFFNRLVPQGVDGYEHDDEGPDDLPAHFKASLLGCSCYCRLRQADWRWAPGKVFTWANIETLVGLVTSWPPFRVSTYNRWRQRLLNFSGCLSNSGRLGYN